MYFRSGISPEEEFVYAYTLKRVGHPHLLQNISVAQLMAEQQVAGEFHFNMLSYFCNLNITT